MLDLLYDSIYISLLIGFIMYFSLTFQKVVFLEYHEPKQEKKIKTILVAGCIVIALLSLLTYSHRSSKDSIYTVYLVVILLYFAALFIWSAFTGRKKNKWLAFIEVIPMLGYYIAFVRLTELCISGIKNKAANDFAELGIYAIVVFVIILLGKKKPKFVQDLEMDIKNRSLSLGQEILVWGVGIWIELVSYNVSSIKLEDEYSYIISYLIITSFVMAVLVVVFVLTSNYREYYNNKNIELRKSLVDAVSELETHYQSTIMALARAIEAKDRYTKGHSARVAKYSKMIASRMGKSSEEQDNIYNVALVHDVGKLRVPENIINKEGKLTDEEYEYIKLHPIAGYNILRDISGDNNLSIGAKFHHERYDGKGYPDGLAGENIPEIARIIAVADAYDAMASNRSYRKALSQEIVRSELEKGMGTQFDPEIAKIMMSIMDDDKEYTLKEMVKHERTILIVDDSNINLMLAENIIKTEPQYNVLKAKSGEEAISTVSDNTVDLIILDIEMPNMDGFETFEKIRKLSDAPVIFMTADKDYTTIERANEMGAKDYITKPFSAPCLKERIYGALFSSEE